MSMEVVNSGFLALLQDYGRHGYQKLGVTTGGPLDEHAFLWANRLLGNEPNATVLEISYGGFSAKIKHDTMIAICGADLSAKINNILVSPWQSYFVEAGDTLSFAMPREGMRSYVAVKGGFLIPKHLSSSATVVREKLGGLRKDGNKIQNGDILAFAAHDKEVFKRVPEKFVPSYLKKISLRFIPNVSVTGVNDEILNQFTSQYYEVTQNIDRMGYRLSGKPIDIKSAGIISQGISMGAIQLPKDGNPIVLMRDRQTIGGYPLVGCVSYLDLALLAQASPGTKVYFVPADVSELEPEYILHKQFFSVPF